MAIITPTPSMFAYGLSDSGAATTGPILNSEFSFEVSGDASWIAFVPPVSQSSATLTVYFYAKVTTGSPTFELEVRNGPQTGQDDDRPEASGSDLATSPSSLSLTSADDDTWVQLTCTVSLTKNQQYFAIIKNTHATPADNYTSFQYRPSIDGNLSNDTVYFAFRAGFTTDGFATDPTRSPSMGLGVVKFASGEIRGCPYVDSANHANDANDRGIRVQFSEDVIASGLYIEVSTSAVTGLEINLAGDGTNQIRVLRANQLYSFANASQAAMFEPIPLTGGVSYDCVVVMSGSTSNGLIYSMGEAEGSLPADVLACRGSGHAHVTGADPGSYTVDTSKTMRFVLNLDDNPAIAGGGGVIRRIPKIIGA